MWQEIFVPSRRKHPYRKQLQIFDRPFHDARPQLGLDATAMLDGRRPHVFGSCAGGFGRRLLSFVFPPRPLVPTFRSLCSIAAPTFTNFGKSWALANLLGSRLIKSTIPELRRGRRKRGSFGRACRSGLRCAGSPSAC